MVAQTYHAIFRFNSRTEWGNFIYTEWINWIAFEAPISAYFTTVEAGFGDELSNDFAAGFASFLFQQIVDY